MLITTEPVPRHIGLLLACGYLPTSVAVEKEDARFARFVAFTFAAQEETQSIMPSKCSSPSRWSLVCFSIRCHRRFAGSLRVCTAFFSTCNEMFPRRCGPVSAAASEVLMTATRSWQTQVLPPISRGRFSPFAYRPKGPCVRPDLAQGCNQVGARGQGLSAAIRFVPIGLDRTVWGSPPIMSRCSGYLWGVASNRCNRRGCKGVER